MQPTVLIPTSPTLSLKHEHATRPIATPPSLTIQLSSARMQELINSGVQRLRGYARSLRCRVRSGYIGSLPTGRFAGEVRSVRKREYHTPRKINKTNERKDTRDHGITGSRDDQLLRNRLNGETFVCSDELELQLPHPERRKNASSKGFFSFEAPQL